MGVLKIPCGLPVTGLELDETTEGVTGPAAATLVPGTEDKGFLAGAACATFIGAAFTGAFTRTGDLRAGALFLTTLTFREAEDPSSMVTFVTPSLSATVTFLDLFEAATAELANPSANTATTTDFFIR